MRFVYCVSCGFEGYVDDGEHQLCNGCRHDPSAIALARKAQSETSNYEQPLGNTLWKEYNEMQGIHLRTDHPNTD